MQLKTNKGYKKDYYSEAIPIYGYTHSDHMVVSLLWSLFCNTGQVTHHLRIKRATSIDTTPSQNISSNDIYNIQLQLG